VDEYLQSIITRKTGAAVQLFSGEFREKIKMPDRLDQMMRKLKRRNIQPCITPGLVFAICPKDGEDSNTLIRHADSAMHRSKHAGKNTYLLEIVVSRLSH